MNKTPMKRECELLNELWIKHIENSQNRIPYLLKLGNIPGYIRFEEVNLYLDIVETSNVGLELHYPIADEQKELKTVEFVVSYKENILKLNYVEHLASGQPIIEDGVSKYYMLRSYQWMLDGHRKNATSLKGKMYSPQVVSETLNIELNKARALGNVLMIEFNVLKHFKSIYN